MLRTFIRLSFYIWLCFIMICALILLTRLIGTDAALVNFWALDNGYANRYLLDMTSGNITTLEQQPLGSVQSANGLLLTTTRIRDFTSAYINDGQESRLLATYNITFSSASWSVDERTVYVLEVIGADTRLYHLDTHIGDIAFVSAYLNAGWRVHLAPDGQYAAVVSRGIGIDGLLVNLASGEAQRIGTSFSAVWSADSRYVAYIEVQVGRTQIPVKLHIWSTDDNQRWTYTSSELDNHTFYPTNNIPFDPVWSPDGEQIALSLLDENQQPGVYLLNPFTGDLQRVLTGWRNVRNWSPDGRYLLLYERLSPEAETITLYDLVEQTEVSLFTTDSIMSDTQVLWSSDGKYLALDYAASRVDRRLFRTFEVATGAEQFSYQLSLRDYFPVTLNAGGYREINWWSEDL